MTGVRVITSAGCGLLIATAGLLGACSSSSPPASAPAAPAGVSSAPPAPVSAPAPAASAGGAIAAGSGTRLLRFPDVCGARVVFTYAGDLWLASTQGGTATRLTAAPGLEMAARFSPDCRQIAFTGQ
jgi:tricorn protease